MKDSPGFSIIPKCGGEVESDVASTSDEGVSHVGPQRLFHLQVARGVHHD